MNTNEFDEDPLDSHLDSESEDEFGLPVFKDRLDPGADASTSGDLGKWSAEDFASIYVRFRPHLVRHAERYISNKALAEEVVQDAFLYLMTSLPELDNEVGVLKFLKWKIRFLAFDVLRSSSVKKEVSTSDSFDDVAENADFVADYERAEDAAIIRLALAKLSPRHREALVASVYEERSTSDLAKQMDLSENATRQLLLRARGAFRKALVGEAETSGKSVSQILAIAAKKTATDVKKNAVRVGISALAIVLGFGLTALPTSDVEETVANLAAEGEIAISGEDSGEDLDSLGITNSEAARQSSSNSDDISKQAGSSDQESQQQDVILSALESTESIPEEAESEPQTAGAPPVIPTEQRTESLLAWDEKSLESILTTNVTQAGFYRGTKSDLASQLHQGETIEVFGGTGISAFIDFQQETSAVRGILFQMNIGGKDYLGVPAITEVERESSGPHSILRIAASDFYIVDSSGLVLSDSPLASAQAILTVDLDNSSNPTAASLSVTDSPTT